MWTLRKKIAYTRLPARVETVRDTGPAAIQSHAPRHNGGTMAPGQKVLSTRELAESLSISRSTVVDAYRQLIAEGYLDARAKSSTFVCLELPEAHTAPRQPLPN